MKKLLALVLALVMPLGLATVGAGAAFADANEIEHTQAVEVMNALGVIGGKENNNFDPDGNVKRSEMAKMITIIALGDVEVSAFQGLNTDLTDINGHWAEAYIKYCYSQGIIGGRGNGKFDPDANVTTSEAAKMLLVALGYNADVQGYIGDSWALNVTRDAQKSGLFKELKNLTSGKALTRDEAAQMIYNTAVEANVIKATPTWDAQAQKTAYTYEEDVGVHLLGKTFDGAKYSGYLKDVEYVAAKNNYKYTFCDDDNFGATIAAADYVGTAGADVTDLSGETDYSALFGQKVDVVYDANKKTIYGIYANDDSTVAYEGVINDLPSTLLAADTSVKISGTTYKFSTDAQNVYVYENLNSVTISGPAGTNTLEDMRGHANYSLATGIRLIDNNGDSKIDVAVIAPFKVDQISYVGSTTFNTAVTNVIDKGANANSVALAAATYTIENVNVYDGMAKKDYVKVIPAANTVDGKITFSKLDVVEGKVSSIKTGEFQLDGTAYKDEGAASIATNTANLDSGYKIAAVNGFAVVQELVTKTTKIGDYAVVISAAAAAGVNPNQAKLLFTDGTTQVVETKNNETGKVGTLVTYKTESGKYVLTTAQTMAATGNADTAGFDVVLDDTNTYAYSTSGNSTINSAKIDDDAVIFTHKDGSTTYKVITGAALKRYATASVTDINNVYGNKDKSTGYTTVALAFVDVAADVSIQTESYAYVTSDVNVILNSKNETVNKLTFWTADGEVADAITDSDESATVAKATLIRYTLNSDGTYAIERADNLKYAAVIAWDGKTARFTDATLDSDGTNSDIKITSSTAIIGIDTDAKKGVEGAEIALAVETGTPTVYQANAYWYSTGGTEADVVFIDTHANAPMSALGGVIHVANTTAWAVVDGLLGNANTTEVVIDGNWTPNDNVTLTANEKLTVGGNIVGASHNVSVTNAQLTVSGNLVTTGTITAATGGTITVSGDVRGNASDATKTGNVDVTASKLNIGGATASTTGVVAVGGNKVVNLGAVTGAVEYGSTGTSTIASATSLTATAGSITASGAVTTLVNVSGATTAVSIGGAVTAVTDLTSGTVTFGDTTALPKITGHATEALVINVNGTTTSTPTATMNPGAGGTTINVGTSGKWVMNVASADINLANITLAGVDGADVQVSNVGTYHVIAGAGTANCLYQNGGSAAYATNTAANDTYSWGALSGSLSGNGFIDDNA